MQMKNALSHVMFLCLPVRIFVLFNHRAIPNQIWSADFLGPETHNFEFYPEIQPRNGSILIFLFFVY